MPSNDDKDAESDTPIARAGDWKGSHAIGTMTEFVYGRYWREVSKISFGGETLVVARHTETVAYMAGILLDDGRYERHCILELEPSSQIGKRLGYPRLYAVRRVMTAKTERGLGIATLLYKWVCTHLGPVMSDREQYFGARRLWASLSRDHEVSVQVVNLDNSEVVGASVRLHQGPMDGDIDHRYWSADLEKEPFRFILTPTRPPQQTDATGK